MEPTNYADFYKIGHRPQYPVGTSLVFSNLTARKSRMSGIEKYVLFGVQAFNMRYLIEEWNNNFFNRPKEEVIDKYVRRIKNSLGADSASSEHLEKLHDLGYLPLHIMALPEGSLIPMRVPCLVLFNTLPEFFWLTNYIETIMSCIIWGPCTSATTANEYRTILNGYADLTVGNRDFVHFQGHDFSFRGMFGLEAAMMSGAAHLLSFVGTDTIPAIDFLETYYGADCEKELIGCSVPATEHSVMSMGTKSGELDTFKRLIKDIYPKGIVSIVSDTFDFWKVITEYLPQLKETILARDGKIVIRPDSGDPVDIICGDTTGLMAEEGTPEYKGAVECLWEIFGGTITEKGYKLLDSHIGLIYGDSITLERCNEICEKLAAKGFASSNIVFGIGSYTYQHVTRDTLGFAVKATYGEVGGEPRIIFKDPATDNGTKKSAKGLLAVYKNDNNNEYYLTEDVSWNEVNKCAFRTVFKDGKIYNPCTLADVRNTLALSRK